MNTFELVLYGALIVSVLQFCLWLYYRATDNAAWVDVGWAYGLGFIVLFYAFNGAGSATSRLLAGIMGGLWSARLGTFLFNRVKNEKEDGRYGEIKRSWKINLPFKFFLSGASLARCHSLHPFSYLGPRSPRRPSMDPVDRLRSLGHLDDWRGGGRSAISAVQIRNSPQGSNLSTRTMALF